MSSFLSTFVFLFILNISLTLINSHPTDIDANDIKNAKKLWLKNYETARNFRCSQPQPRAITAYELLADQLLTTEKVSPHSTVIYRCDMQSGCCSSQHQCAPLSQEPVVLWFWTNDTFKKTAAFKKVTVYNHTECACQYINEQPK